MCLCIDVSKGGAFGTCFWPFYCVIHCLSQEIVAQRGKLSIQSDHVLILWVPVEFSRNFMPSFSQRRQKKQSVTSAHSRASSPLWGLMPYGVSKLTWQEWSGTPSLILRKWLLSSPKSRHVLTTVHWAPFLTMMMVLRCWRPDTSLLVVLYNPYRIIPTLPNPSVF